MSADQKPVVSFGNLLTIYNISNIFFVNFIAIVSGQHEVTMREPKLGQVFNFKLASFAIMKEMHGAIVCPYLKLKTWPGFCPAGLTWSVNCGIKQSFHKTSASLR
jgi:hypothetical protein